MVRPADPATRIAKMAELRAVQAAYPLYGTILLQGGQTYSHSLLEQHGALVRPELLSALQLKVGDQICRRPDDVHHPRRHCEGAWRRTGRIQPRPADLHRL